MRLNNCLIGKIVIYFCLTFVVDNTFVYAGEKVNLNAKYEIVDVSFGDCNVCSNCDKHKRIVGSNIIINEDIFANYIFKSDYSLFYNEVLHPEYILYNNENLKSWSEEVADLYNKKLGNLYIVFNSNKTYSDVDIYGIFYDLEGDNPIQYVAGCIYKLKKIND